MTTCYKPVLLVFLLLLGSAMSQSNEWSNCSRTCGLGISHRSIPCQNTNCTGAQKEFQVCKLKECPDHHIDFRSEQCQKYGEGLMPYINTSNPCILMCASPGQTPVEKAIAIDGTPCSSDGICVDGMCVAVGCDGILGSEEKTDECGRCGSTSGICLRVPCTINHTSTNEYNIVLPIRSTKIKITWTPFCNFSVFPVPANSSIEDKNFTIDSPLEEKITVKINCQASGHILTCGYNIPLYDITYIIGTNHENKNKEYQWIVGNDFTACSQTCGTGVRRSKIYCQNKETKRIAHVSLCDDLLSEHLDAHTRIKFCNTPPCPYKWDVTDWSPCSRSCGGGHRRRNITCVQVINKLTDPVIRDPTQCPKDKPRSQETCNHHHCYNHWRKGPWSDCSSSCGNGTQMRNITCINAQGMEIEANNCNSSTRPKEERECTGVMCTYRWIASDWSKCSVNCGKGNQTRNVSCQYIMEEKIVNDSLCLQTKKLTTMRRCQGSYCVGTLKVEEWGRCEAGGCHLKGLQHRNYFCVINESNGVFYIDETNCNDSVRPERTRKCFKTEGCSPDWVPTPWNECSTTCGSGFRVRGLECKLGDTVLDDKECPPERLSVVEDCDTNVQCPPTCSPAPSCFYIVRLYCRTVDPSNKEVLELACKQQCCSCDCKITNH